MKVLQFLIAALAIIAFATPVLACEGHAAYDEDPAITAEAGESDDEAGEEAGEDEDGEDEAAADAPGA